MRKSPNYWNKSRIYTEAKQFSGREDFRLNSRSAYNASKRLGLYEELCKDLFGNKKNKKQTWTKKEAKEIIDNCKYKKDIYEDNNGLYRFLKEKGWYDSLTKNFKQKPSNLIWTRDSLLKEIKKHKKTVILRKKNPSAYQAIVSREKDLLNLLTKQTKEENSNQKKKRAKDNKKKIIKELISFSSRFDCLRTFKKEHPKECKKIYYHKIEDKCVSHMKYLEIYSFVKLKKELKKYKSINEINDSNLLNYLKYLRELDHDHYHMGLEYLNKKKNEKHPRLYYTYDICKAKASKCKTKKEFREKYKNYYSRSREKGFLKDFFKKEESFNYKKKELLKEIKKFDNFYSFRISRKKMIRFAKEHNLIDTIKDYYGHKAKTRWNFELCKTEALKYKSRQEFYEKSGSAYNKALRENWMDDLCSHMETKGNNYKRKVYYVLFKDESIYVGLTYNPVKRFKDHIRKEDSQIHRKLKKEKIDLNYSLINTEKDIRVLFGEIGAKVFISKNYYEKEQAVVEEKKLLNKMKSKGFFALNKAKCGALGGTNIKWTKEKILKESLRYDCRTKFIKENRRAYDVARRTGILDEVYTNMKPSNIKKWDKTAVIKESEKYYSRSKFLIACPSAYQAAKRLNILELVSKEMKPSNRGLSAKKWACSLRDKYNSIKEFKINEPKAYMAYIDTK